MEISPLMERRQASLGEKFVFNIATHKLAAKLMYDKQLTKNEALMVARGEAWSNTLTMGLSIPYHVLTRDRRAEDIKRNR